MRKTKQLSNYWVWGTGKHPYRSVMARTPEEALRAAGEYGKTAYRVDNKHQLKNYPVKNGVVVRK